MALATLLKEDHLVVGDWVELAPPAQEGQDWVIEKVIERQNSIFRNLPREQKKKVIAANVDVLLVVASAGKPVYKRGLVDRYLVRSDYWNVPAYVVFNKMDLYETNHFDEWLEEGVKEMILRELKERWEHDTNGHCVFISALERRNIDELRHTILKQVKEMYRVRYPYKTGFF
jgi:putative ribosome biogenesis GTPase RsgA